MTVPVGFQTRYFQTTSTADYPQTVRDGAFWVVPCFISEETNEEGVTNYTFYAATVPFRGTDKPSLSDLRAFFYGSQAAQSEMRDDHVWEAHRQAVRSAFPKHEGDGNPAQDRFEDIYKRFWDTIDAALKDLSKTRADLPDFFTAEYMLAFATENGMTQTKISKYAQTFSTLSLDLLHNDRNWAELFNA